MPRIEFWIRVGGRAVVFDGKADLDANLYRPDFDVRPGDVVVLRGEGPRGSGMPESGRIAVPDKLLQQGITDMVRITDSRLGGTVKQTAVLHIAPEAVVGGPLGLVRTGDMISLDVPNRRLNVEVSDSELAERAGATGAQEHPGPRLCETGRRERHASQQGLRSRFPGPAKKGSPETGSRGLSI